MRQTSAAAAIHLFIALLWYCCTCTALRVLRFATQFVTLLAAHTAFVTAAPVSFLPPHSFRPSFRSITPRSQPDHLLQGMAHYPTHKAKAQVMHIPFSQAMLQYSLGSIPLHYVLHSFRSHSVHPLPIILLALRTTVCVTGLH
jgi:hypothetical protein